MASDSDWEVRMSKSKGLPYFFNEKTKQSSWSNPGLSEDDVKSLRGADLLKPASSAGAKPASVVASHLLVKHKDSRRPASWKEDRITRTKEEAIEILKGYQEEINSDPLRFAELATEHSDCSSHANSGSLGRFTPDQMQKAFEDAAFGLEVGEMSDIIETDSGVHLVLRTA